MVCSGTWGLTDVGRLMGGSFHGELGSGSRAGGDKVVAHDAPLVVEGERERRETGGTETQDHVRATIRWHTEEEESPPARSGNLAAIGAALPRDLVPAVDLRRAHTPRQTALELPAFVQQRTELRQIAGQQRRGHGCCQLLDAMQ